MIAFLNHKQKLVDAVADWLSEKAEIDPSGARSLSHLMVIVPTAQAGRNLRLTLAQKAAQGRWGGILPPRVVLPFQLIVPADQSLPDANEAVLAALFTRFVSEKRGVALTSWPHLFKRAVGSDELQAVIDPEAGFALFDQMSDIWRVLAGKGLLMQDVPTNAGAAKVLDRALGDEKTRWEELASFEKQFFDFLATHGVRHPVQSVALARNAAAPLDSGIREIVLPALSDPVLVLHDVLAQYAECVQITTLLHCAEADRHRFDMWGRPKVELWTGDSRPTVDGLADGDIVSVPDDKALAARLVRDFPMQSSGRKLPALGLCDPELYTTLSSAFLNAGYVVQNPERNRLAASSLGMLIRDLLVLWRPADAGVPWANFAALMRSYDVLSELKSAEIISSRSLVLQGLDVYQNVCLPTFVADKLAIPQWDLHDRDMKAVQAFVACGNEFLAWLAEARRERPLVAYLREMLGRIFSAKRLGGTRSEQEFTQAVACVQNVLAMLSSEHIGKLGLSDGSWIALARRLFEQASYSLEAEESNVVRTEGWLELVWSRGDKVALAGLHEGAVPDSVVGHPFLPNELREALGLMSNVTRLARDSWLLKEMVDSHAGRTVRAYVSRTKGKGDICRPSRLLFLCSDEALATRVKGLFGDAGEAALTPRREISEAWRLRLRDEVPIKGKDGQPYLSPSAIDTWLKSPLEYYFKNGLGMGDRYEEKQELGFNDYGTFIHRVLELFAREQKDRPLLNEAGLGNRLEQIVDREIARFGVSPTMNVRLQLRSAKDRLLRFAEKQAEWVQAGWRVEGTEVEVFAKPFDDLDIAIRGFVDRVDYRVLEDGSREFRIIDYKTWDEVGKISGHIKSHAKKEIEFAGKLKLPRYSAPPKKKGDKPGRPVRMLTVQLPLYGACLKAQYPDRFDGPIVDYVYLVLAEDRVELRSVQEYANVSLMTARVAIKRIMANIFWPPRVDDKGELHDFGRLFAVSPERDLCPDGNGCAWVKRQEAKLAALENAGGEHA